MIPTFATTVATVPLIVFQDKLSKLLQQYQWMPYLVVCVYGVVPIIWLSLIDTAQLQIKIDFNFLAAAGMLFFIPKTSELLYLFLVLGEEYVARCVLLNIFYHYHDHWWSIVLGAWCFAAGHLYHQKPLLTLASGVLGLLNGYLWVRYRNFQLIFWIHYYAGIIFFRLSTQANWRICWRQYSRCGARASNGFFI